MKISDRDIIAGQLRRHSMEILKAADILKNAAKPLILLEEEAALSQDMDMILFFAENYHAPIICSCGNKALKECDVLLRIGADKLETDSILKDIRSSGVKIKIIHIAEAASPEADGCDCFLQGTPGEILNEINSLLPGRRNHGDRTRHLSQLNSEE